MKNLDLEKPQGLEIKFLFGTKFDVEYMNIEELDTNIDGAPKYFKAEDTGNKNLLLYCAASKVLTLKVGAPGILIRNISSRLFNGCMGNVHSLENEQVIVNFDGNLVNLERCVFEEFCPKTKTILASRIEFPIKLAYAVTVHRAQGQSIDYLEVDCFSFFAPGQMGVALG